MSKITIIIPNIYEMRKETASELLKVLYKIEDQTGYRLKGGIKRHKRIARKPCWYKRRK